MVRSTIDVGEYSAYSIDLLLKENDIGSGTFSAGAAYYGYDADDVFLGEQGKAYSAGVAYLLNAQRKKTHLRGLFNTYSLQTKYV